MIVTDAMVTAAAIRLREVTGMFYGNKTWHQLKTSDRERWKLAAIEILHSAIQEYEKTRDIE